MKPGGCRQPRARAPVFDRPSGSVIESQGLVLFERNSNGVHELSFAQSVVEIVLESLPTVGSGRVSSIRIKVGELTGVDFESLRFGFEVATRDTPLQGSRLEIQRVPVVIHCSQCDRLVALPGVQNFRCPVCSIPSADVREGRDVEVESFEFDGDGGPP